MKPEDVTKEMIAAFIAAPLSGGRDAMSRNAIAAAINAMPQTDAQAQIDALKAERDALQEKIDVLMFEFCPSEMTQEQVDNWRARKRGALAKEPSHG